jgi:hypothetical protein
MQQYAGSEGLRGQQYQGGENILNRYLSSEQTRVGTLLGIEAGKQQFAGAGWSAAAGFVNGMASPLGGIMGGMMGGMGGGAAGGADSSLSAAALAARQNQRGF